MRIANSYFEHASNFVSYTHPYLSSYTALFCIAYEPKGIHLSLWTQRNLIGVIYALASFFPRTSGYDCLLSPYRNFFRFGSLTHLPNTLYQLNSMWLMQVSLESIFATAPYYYHSSHSLFRPRKLDTNTNFEVNEKPPCLTLVPPPLSLERDAKPGLQLYVCYSIG